MNGRKCREYYIVIEYQNGEKSTIEYLDEREIDNTNYKEMISVYKDTKEQFKDVSCVIRFMGRTNDDEESMEIFAKIIKNDETYTPINIENELSIVMNALNNIQESIDGTSDNIGLADKRVSQLLHKIESTIEPTSKCKISMFDELKAVSNYRRQLKISQGKTNAIKELINISIGNIASASNKIAKVDEKSNTSKEQINNEEGKAYDKNSIKEYTYNNFKDRMNMMKQLQPKYDKVVHDTERELICCYNKVYK